jgi:hypothetical protein
LVMTRLASGRKRTSLFLTFIGSTLRALSVGDAGSFREFAPGTTFYHVGRARARVVRFPEQK